jgi:hypothetical protein
MEIKIAKIKVRRGSNNERKTVILDQGELAYTSDTKRLYVGNGVLSGGDVVGNKNHLPITQYNSLSSIAAEIGDLTSISGSIYQLTAQPATTLTNWIPLSTRNVIALSSLSASQINPLTVNNGIKIESDTLQVNFNTKFFQISSTQLSIRPSAIDQREISSTSFGNGISGGSGNLITLNVDPTYFTFDTGKLTLEDGIIGNSVFDSLTGLIDNNTLVLNDSGDLSMDNLSTSNVKEIASLIVDDYGRVIKIESSIYDTLTGYDLINPMFNGRPAHSLSGAIAGLTLTKLSAISANPTSSKVIVLSSAGFLTFEGNDVTRTGKSFGRFAIPIYTY